MEEQQEALLDGLGTDPCAIVFESGSGIDSVISEAKRLAKAQDSIVAVKEEKQIVKRLLPAYVNAYLRHKEGSMHAGSLSLETMLFVAGNMNITNAAKKVAAQGHRFVLFSSSRALAQELAKRCKLKRIREEKLSFDYDVASDVAMTAIKDDK